MVLIFDNFIPVDNWHDDDGDDDGMCDAKCGF